MFRRRYRTTSDLLISLIFIIIILYETNPMYTILGIIGAILLFVLFKKVFIPYIDKQNLENEKGIRRKAALNEAKIFLAPYKNIWRNLKLSNKFCSLYLGNDGVSITCTEKKSPYRKFNVVTSKVHDYYDLWDMFCIGFDYNTTYEKLVDECWRYKLVIHEFTNKKRTNTDIEKASDKKNIKKVNINNCSEIELTELPGISIVTAKKIIKKREEINGFKTIEEFFSFIKLKPHMENQIKDRIHIEKMNYIDKKTKRNSERNVDI